MIAVYIFYSKATGIQSWLSFSKEFKHCNIITYDGKDWIMLDLDRTGLLTRRIKCNDGDTLIRNLPHIPEITAIISVDVKDRVRVAWKPFWVRSCNEICRYASGVDIGISFNPVHLYNKLIKYDGSNYEILSHWRRSHGVSGRGQ